MATTEAPRDDRAGRSFDKAALKAKYAEERAKRLRADGNAQYLRLKDNRKAWASTRKALGAVGWSIAIELVTGVLAAGVWVGALVFA